MWRLTVAVLLTIPAMFIAMAVAVIVKLSGSDFLDD